MKKLNSLIIQYQKAKSSKESEEIFIINSAYCPTGRLEEQEILRFIYLFGYSQRYKKLSNIHFEGKDHFTKFINYLIYSHGFENIYTVDIKSSLKEVLSLKEGKIEDCFYNNREVRGYKEQKRSRSFLNRVFSF